MKQNRKFATVFVLVACLTACGEDGALNNNGGGGTNACATNNGGCAAGTTCATRATGQVVCVPDNPSASCANVTCEGGGMCSIAGGKAVCSAPSGACATNNGGCAAPAVCATLANGQAVCIQPTTPPVSCAVTGCAAGFTCASSGLCVQNPPPVLCGTTGCAAGYTCNASGVCVQNTTPPIGGHQMRVSVGLAGLNWSGLTPTSCTLQIYGCGGDASPGSITCRDRNEWSSLGIHYHTSTPTVSFTHPRGFAKFIFQGTLDCDTTGGKRYEYLFGGRGTVASGTHNCNPSTTNPCVLRTLVVEEDSVPKNPTPFTDAYGRPNGWIDSN